MRRPRPAFLSLVSAAATFLTPLLVTAETAPAVAAPPPAVDAGSMEDPNADRGFLLPTALTQPKNTLTITDYEIFMLGLTLGITDRLQVGGATMLIGGGGFLFPGAAVLGSLKWQFLRAGNLRLAALAGAQYASVASHDALPGEGGGHTRHLRPQTGLVGSFCLSTDCHSLLSANAIVSSAREAGAFRSATVLYSAGGTLHLSDHWKLLLEYSQSTIFSRDLPSSSDPTVSIGFRLFGRRLAAEGGVMMLINDVGDTLPLPFLSATARL